MLFFQEHDKMYVRFPLLDGDAAFLERKRFVLQRPSHRSPWRWYRSQRRAFQVTIGVVVTLVVIFACALVVGSVSRAAQSMPTREATPTALPDYPTPPGTPTNVFPVTPVLSPIAQPTPTPTTITTPTNQPTT